MAVAPIGDTVRVEDDERLDIPDFNALQTLIYETLADVIGGLFGECSGVLGWPTFGTTPASAITVGECVFVGVRRRTGSSHRPRGGVFPYNPASTYQTGSTTLDLFPYSGAEENPYLWFARTEMVADVASRRRHTAGSENTFTPETRVRQRIIFGTSPDKTLAPDENNDWFVWGRVVDWNAGVPVIEPFHPFERGNLADSGSTNDSKIAYILATVASLTDPGVNLGVAEYIDVLRRAVLMALDSDWTFNNDTGGVATAGEVGLLSPVTGGTDFIGGKQAKERIEALEASPKLVLWGRVIFTSGTPSFANITRLQTPADADTDVSKGVTQLGVKCNGHPVVHVTPSSRSGGDFTGTAPTLSVEVTTGTGANGWVITVKGWDNANANEDVDFHIVVFGALG